MARPFQLAAALALTLLPTACSSAGSAGAVPATAWVAAERKASARSEAAASLPMPSLPPALVPDEPSETPRPRVAPPLTVLNQMVTTQALLVSLLLAPVATDAPPRAGATSKASGSARSN